MPHRKLNVSALGVIESYESALSQRGYAPDEAQKAAAVRLQQLYSELLAFKVARGSRLKRLLARPSPPKGVYFWGGVGRGKSFLMDCFFESVPYRRKKRIHFHAFMQKIHVEIERHKGLDDPLKAVAEAVARETRLLCFDEFHVSDIADAMMLGRLVETLMQAGVVFVMTSNYPPSRLYPNGLHRDRFLPTIELLQRSMDVVEVDAGTDYRLRHLEQLELYHTPADQAAEVRMEDYFRQVSGEIGNGKRGVIEVLGRPISFLRESHGVIWFDFNALCAGPRSQNDYLEIARGYHTVLLSAVPRMGAAMSSEARRFTWLVDVLYDHRVKLIITAACEAEELYREGTQSSEFFRTVSRLIEMRSSEYLGLPHLTD